MLVAAEELVVVVVMPMAIATGVLSNAIHQPIAIEATIITSAIQFIVVQEPKALPLFY